MGILSKLTGRGNIKDECHTDPNTKEVSCKTFRVNSDGTQTEIAGLKMQMAGDCSVVMTDAHETEDGALKRLEDKFANRVVAKCRRDSQSSRPPEGY